MKNKISTKEEFLKVFSNARAAASHATGFLSERDCYILTLLTVCSEPDGEVLEIGSYQGLSTVLLATALRYTDRPRMHACDPWAAPGVAGQDVKTDDGTFHRFREALITAEVTDQVVVHRAFSSTLSQDWQLPLRFLWIDGDHSLAGAISDFEQFAPHVIPGGFVAFHDVLHPHPGPSQVFCSRVLLSEEWGACGFCGSIGWAQKARSPADARQHRSLKQRLFRRLSPLAKFAASESSLQGMNRWKYKIRRALVPRQAPSFSEFCSLIGQRAA